MRLTSFGRPVGEFPLFRLRDGEGRWFLALSRVDVSDVGKEPRAEATYVSLFERDTRDGMETWRIGRLIIFITQRGIQHHVIRNQTPEE